MEKYVLLATASIVEGQHYKLDVPMGLGGLHDTRWDCTRTMLRTQLKVYRNGVILRCMTVAEVMAEFEEVSWQ